VAAKDLSGVPNGGTLRCDAPEAASSIGVSAFDTFER